MTSESLFVLPFAAQDLCHLEDGYLRRTTGSKQSLKTADEIVLKVGRKIREGECTKSNLKKIFQCKNEDSRFWKKLEADFDSNPCERIATTLALADKAKSEAEAVGALIKLSGVGVPTASAILMAIYPERYTVIDQLALRALGISNQEIAFYVLYNAACRDLAREHGVCLRTLDRALWEYGKRHPPKRRTRNGSSYATPT